MHSPAIRKGMRIYYLNNFILARYTDCDDPIWFRSDTLPNWIEDFIQHIRDSKERHFRRYSTKFNLNLCFDNLMETVEEHLNGKELEDDVKKIFMALFRSNRDAIVSLSETEEYYYIDMVEGRLVAIFPDE